MSNNNQSIYYVWCPQGGAPNRQHDSPSSATTEAKRLAKLNPDKSFYVLRAIAKIKYQHEPFAIENYCKRERVN